MAELSEQSARHGEDRRAADVALAMRDSSTHGALYWTVVPEVALKMLEGGAHGSRSVVAQLPRSVVRSVVRRTGPALERVGPLLFVSTSVQHDRVFKPLLDASSGALGVQRTEHLPRLKPPATSRAIRDGSRLARQIASWSPINGMLRGGNVTEMVCQAAVLLERARRLFNSADPPKVLVVATQHGAAARALVRAALESSTTQVVYMPHAPVARNPWYQDLPVHRALLRGTAEASVYAGLGVELDRMRVVGDPSLPIVSGNSEPLSDPAVYAVSTDDPLSLAEDVRVIVDAAIGAVEVCMHPRLRSRDDLRALFPAEWAFNELPSTYARLKAGRPTALVQHGSGVGLEALMLGLPLIDLCNPGREPSYYYLGSSAVPSVASSEQLGSAIATIDLSEHGADTRREYARTWMAATGADAAHAAVNALMEIVEMDVPSQVLLDGWSGPRSAGH